MSVVSSSIPNMTKEDVTVIDQNGQLLSKSLDDPNSMLNDSQLEHRIKLENIYRSRITSLVTPIVGPGNVRESILAHSRRLVQSTNRSPSCKGHFSSDRARILSLHPGSGHACSIKSNAVRPPASTLRPERPMPAL